MSSQNDMDFRTVELEDFAVNCKEDLLRTTILVPIERDFHGRMMYDRQTPWELIEDFEQFKEYINTLSVEDIINYRDELDGNILSSFASSGKSIEWFEVIALKVGDDDFMDMLMMKDRRALCPFALISNVETFAALLPYVNFDILLMRQIIRNNRTDVLAYLASLMNQNN